MSVRRTVAAIATDDVSHTTMLVIAFAVAAVGVLILVVSRCATTFSIATGAGLVLAGVVIAIPTRAKQVRHEMTSVVRAIRGVPATRTLPP